jgi:hypothetical protein
MEKKNNTISGQPDNIAFRVSLGAVRYRMVCHFKNPIRSHDDNIYYLRLSAPFSYLLLRECGLTG